MRARFGIFPILLILLVMIVCPSVHAQRACPAAPIPTLKPGANIFNTQQEMDLGDAMAEQFQREYHVIDDPALTAYLQRVGDRLVQHVSIDGLKYQFVLYDQPVANAFGTTGGRIYVSRKLVGFMHSEDELAGLLGHEIGHMVAHQTAMEMTLLFQKVIGVSSVSGRQDIIDKYQQYVDNAARKPEISETIARQEEPNQLIADRLGLFATSASGYDPRALVQFWDRFAETKGKTGNFFSDLFGSTKPEQHRLRELEAEMPTLPGPCGDVRPPASDGEFAAWKAAVMNYSGLGHRESLHGVLLKQALTPPLRGDIRHLRFSPDGKYAVAQDDASIYVLSRQPFAPLFRIDAPEAYEAMFSSDSQTLSFHTTALRVETWNLAGQQRTGLHDMVIQHTCTQTVLSPDGKFLACEELVGPHLDLSDNVVGIVNMELFDVSTGQIAFERKEFARIPAIEVLRYLFSGDHEDLRIRLTTMRFSPDSHYFVAASHGLEALAVELPSAKIFSLPPSIKKVLIREFVFLSSDQILGVVPNAPNGSAVLKFPGGDIVEELTLGMQNVQAASHGRYVLLRPIDKYSLGVMDLETKKVFMADASPAFDLFDSTALVTHANGALSLKETTTKQDTASLSLPRGALAPLRAVALSSDLKWLAVSERSRGAVWDIANNQLAFSVRGFAGAYFTPDGLLYADFPKLQESARMIGQFNPAAHSQAPAYKVEGNHVSQMGPILLERITNGKAQYIDKDITIQVRDTVTNNVLWSRPFPNEAPTIVLDTNSGRMALLWRISTASASSELKTNPELAKHAESVSKDERNYLIEILDGRSGKFLGGFALDTNKGSFAPVSVVGDGDHVVITDSANRIQMYSLASGKQTAKIFGSPAVISTAAGVFVAGNDRGQLMVYDLATMEKKDELQFNSTLVTIRFSGDGKRLFVLTSGQTAYVLDVAALSRPPGTTASGAK